MSNPKDREQPTIEVKDALNELLQRNERTRGAEVGEMYLGSDIFVARLVRPVVIEGKAEDIDKTADIFDLMDDHQAGRS